MRPLLPCLAALVLASPAVRADGLPSAHFTSFSLQYLNDEMALDPVPSHFSVLATGVNQTDIGLDSMEAIAHVVYGSSWGESGIDLLSLGLHANAGYRITGVRLTASFAGVLRLPTFPAGAVVDPNSPGLATNRASVDLTSYAGDWAHRTASSHYERTDITTAVPFDTLVGNSSGTPDILLEIDSAVHVDTAYGYYDLPANEEYSMKSPSYGELSMNHPVLTVYTEALPVPEPAQWSMLAAGVGLLAVGRRRRPVRPA